MNCLRVALAQINTTVGDIKGNEEKIIDYIHRAKRSKADIVVFPELPITGYPPEDLVLKTDFIRKNMESLERIAGESKNIAAVVGFVESDSLVYNSAAFIYDGRIHGTYQKIFLPNYGVFDEKRYFSPGREVSIFQFGDILLGVNICEDIWYPDGPAVIQAVSGAGIILNLNASPYQMGKWRFRESMIATRAADNAAYVVYVNCVGGQDELVFEGGSLVLDPSGALVARGKLFQEDFIVADLDPKLPFRTRLHDLRIRERVNIYQHREPVRKTVIPVGKEIHRERHPVKPEITRKLLPGEEVYLALVLGVRDYIQKNGFKSVALGISGGVDSALVAAIAVDALGPENVIGIFMPSRYTSKESREDSERLSANLRFKLLEVSIEEIYEKYLTELASLFRGYPEDNTEQNIQARIRGNLLMAYSNKFGSLVLTTGNKSEMSVGYATLYGDMAGGFAAIKDIPKTMVYKLARYRNSLGLAIPSRILTRAPSAELKEDQKDTDNLPPYDVLDPILRGLIEEDRDIDEMESLGFHRETISRVAKMIHTSEYKRRQAPPGVKVTPRAFGRDRRIPLTNKYY